MKTKTPTILISLLLVIGLLAGCTLIPTPFPRAQLISSNPITGGVEVVFIDVGQGDATLIISPEGNTMLIDAGAVNSGARQYLEGRGITRLDVAVATHPDADHIGGMAEVLLRIPTERVVTSGQLHTTLTFERFIDAIDLTNADYIEVRRGDKITLGTLIFDVLSPVDGSGSDLNNGSVVLRLVYGKTTFLFTGDAESKAEAGMLAAGVPLKADILKLGHHGSRSSTSGSFLGAVRPAVAIYSAGAGNRFGHPHPEVITRVNASGAQIYGTDTLGTIIVRADLERYQVLTAEGGEISRPATATPAPMGLVVTSVSSPITPGSMASLEALTAPDALCSITVFTKSGASQAQGLDPMTADSDGSCRWSWRVGAGTTPGVWKIVVSARGVDAVTGVDTTLTQEITYEVIP